MSDQQHTSSRSIPTLHIKAMIGFGVLEKRDSGNLAFHTSLELAADHLATIVKDYDC